jgi:ATP-binding cassette subfamily B (MDR/TAP) protein 1
VLLLTSFISFTTVVLTLGDWRILLLYFLGFFICMFCQLSGQTSSDSAPENYKAKGDNDKKMAQGNRVAGAIVGEVVGAIRTVASFNAETRFLADYSAKIETERGRLMGWKILVRAPILMGIGQGGILVNVACVNAYGLWLTEHYPETFLGSSIAGCPIPIFSVGRLLVANYSVIGFFMGLGASAATAIDGSAAMEAAVSLFSRIDHPSQQDPFDDSGATLQDVRGEVTVDRVVFAYPIRPELKICSGYSLSIPAGTSCALVGPSGSGKSTIIALLERFYDPQEGSLTLDGVDIKTLNLRWLRSQLGLVGQEPVLFIGTVEQNIQYGKQDATYDEVEEAARMANAHDFITSVLGKGYETQVGLGGTQLSGGQKQRIAIARAIVRKPAVMLLDEATSALDNESETLVQAALDEIMTKRKRTTLMIAHRLSTIRDANQIAVINKGCVVESGTHDELVRSGKGLYAELLTAQNARRGSTVPSPQVERRRPS